jgi:hypothetical protein
MSVYSFPPTFYKKPHRYRIPWRDTAYKKAFTRAEQATSKLMAHAKMEHQALSILTKAGCSSSPTLFKWMQGKQGGDQWVPSGYIVHLLMEKMPGISPVLFNKMDLVERDALRTAFKKAWM